MRIIFDPRFPEPENQIIGDKVEGDIPIQSPEQLAEAARHCGVQLIWIDDRVSHKTDVVFPSGDSAFYALGDHREAADIRAFY
ncbi:MAG: hypothetical protein AAGK02_01440 [Pseudomonadota bacterium]